MSELYCDSLSKESAVQRDVREGVEGNVGAEVGGVRDVRWNRVSPDSVLFLLISWKGPGYKVTLHFRIPSGG